MRVHVLILCGIWFCRKLSRRCCLFCLSMMRIFGVQTRWNDWHNFAFYFLVCARCFCVCVLFFIWNDNQQLRMAAKSIRKYHTIEKINHVNKIKRKKKYEKSKTSLIVVVVNVTFWHRSDATADKYEWNRSRDFRIKRNLNFRIWYVAWKCDSIWAMTDSMKLTTTQSTAWRSFGFWCFRSETKDFYQRCNYTNGKFQMSI